MGPENGIHLLGDASENAVVFLFFGMDNVELGHVVSLDVHKARGLGDFAEGACQGQWVAAEFRRTGVGHVFALAGNGQAVDEAEEIGDRGNDHAYQRKEDDDYGSAIALPSATGTPGAADHALEDFDKDGLHQRNHAHKDNAHHHQSGVTVFDVGQFVGHDGG